MPNYKIEKETKILGDIAEIVFGSHHYANITRAHASGEIVAKRMRLCMKSPYWDRIQPQPIKEQVKKKVYQPTSEEKKSLQSLCHYIEKQIRVLCTGTPLAVLESSPKARKRGNSKAKTSGILIENQNQVERYLTVLRGLFDDPPEQATTFPNPFRKTRDLAGNDETEFGLASYKKYSLRLILAAIWQAASEENPKKWTKAFDSFSKKKSEAISTAKENFISVLAECMRAYNKQDSFDSPDNPSCDLGAVERLLLRGAPFNKCFLPSESEDQQDKLINVQHSVDHYLIDKLDNFCTESDKALMFRVLSNRVLMDEPDALSEKTYQAIFKKFTNLLSSEEQDPNDLYHYLVKCLSGFPWQSDSKLNIDVLKTCLFELLVTRIDVFTSIELENPYGLMNAENQNSLNRLLMLCSLSLANDIWIENYQNLDEAKEFEHGRIGLKALEISKDTLDLQCALEPNLFYTKKIQSRFNYLWSEYQEKANQFTNERGEKIKAQIDQLTKDKLKHEFSQEREYDTRRIIDYTLTSIYTRLRRLEKKFSEFTPESIQALYQASLETLWDNVSTEEEPILSSIAPRGIRLNQEQYQRLAEKQKKQLAWSLHIANLAACFDQNGHVDRQRDISRGFAAMRGRTLDSPELEAETFEQAQPSLLKKDIEAVIWIACSIIRELPIFPEQQKIAWSTLEDVCKDNRLLVRYISFDNLMEKLNKFLEDNGDISYIWQKLPTLLSALSEGKEKIDSSIWLQYAASLYNLPDLRGLVWFSLLSVMSSLKLEKLHLANKQFFNLWCKLFKGDDTNFNSDEKSVRELMISENAKIKGAKEIKWTIEGLSQYLRLVTDLIESNEKFHAYFAEGIITATPRGEAEQLAKLVALFTKRGILYPRLSSSFPGKIAITVLNHLVNPIPIPYTISHIGPLSIEGCYNILEEKVSNLEYHNMHIIAPGGNFDHKKILKEQEINHIKTRNKYVKMLDDSPSSSLGSALQNLNRYTPAYSNLPASKSTLFQENSDSLPSERETKRELRPG